MEHFKIEIDGKQIKEMYNSIINRVIEESLSKYRENIELSVKTYFDKGFFKDKISSFESALDWAIEASFRDGINKAMESLDFKEMIAEKAKELLSSNDFISKLAEAKVRASLGLPSLPQ